MVSLPIATFSLMSRERFNRFLNKEKGCWNYKNSHKLTTGPGVYNTVKQFCSWYWMKFQQYEQHFMVTKSANCQWIEKKKIFCLGLVYLIATQERKLPTTFRLFSLAWWKQHAEVRKLWTLKYTCKAQWKSKFLPHIYLHHDIIW